MNTPKNSGPHRTAPSDLNAQIRERVEHRREQSLDRLISLIGIPGIAFPGYDRAPLEASAEAVAKLIGDLGFDNVEIYQEPLDPQNSGAGWGGPAVLASKSAAPGMPTVLLYAHHDVQPVGDLREWESDPLKPEIRQGRLFGRGAADDKAGIMVHLEALEALADIQGEDFGGVGVTLFIEGEEEAGSPTFTRFLETHRDTLAADVMIIADSSNWKVGVPALTTSLRGLVDGFITVKVAEHAVHSGVFGGPMLDAATILARILATLHTEDGDVAVPGLTAHHKSELEYAEQDYRQQTGAVSGLKLAGSGALADRLWNHAALNILGTDLPTLEQASNTMIPEATAKFSLRLGPGMDPHLAMQAVQEHVERVAELRGLGAEITVTPGEIGHAFSADTESPATLLYTQCLREAFNAQPVFTGLGGSIPFIAELAQLYPNAQILITGVEDPDTRAHSANESLHLGDFYSAIVAEALFLARIPTMGMK